ncbi:MAG: hypothetical protein IAX21_00790 [Candidatus Bathyarchaeota archaeon]|nr:hypothetical protein [Candidatus Bathyarchaeum tardum]WGM90493.1 MAG: hypothetical protein NUK63_05050 [Candidatus Bathyarchaeum tardum]WNZ29439.1 MAG: hypothetical protein IAX21_00790 [Candidatus Bathyarchaeota archaeon]
MKKITALKCGLLVSLIITVSLASVMYAFAYNVKREVIYTDTFQLGEQTQTFRAFYLPAPAVMFEVKLTVSQGSIKWSPFSDVLFDVTFDSFDSLVNQSTYGTLQGWECETHNGSVNWRIDSEHLNQIWYLCFLNDDAYEKEVTVTVTKVWSEQNYLDWL